METTISIRIARFLYHPIEGLLPNARGISYARYPFIRWYIQNKIRLPKEDVVARKVQRVITRIREGILISYPLEWAPAVMSAQIIHHPFIVIHERRVQVLFTGTFASGPPLKIGLAKPKVV